MGWRALVGEAKMRLLENIHNYDLLTFDWCLRRRRRHLVVKISRWVSFTANGPFYVLAGLASIFAQYWPLAALLAVGFLIERATYTLAKSRFRRSRPPHLSTTRSSIARAIFTRTTSASAAANCCNGPGRASATTKTSGAWRARAGRKSAA